MTADEQERVRARGDHAIGVSGLVSFKTEPWKCLGIGIINSYRLGWTSIGPEEVLDEPLLPLNECAEVRLHRYAFISWFWIFHYFRRCLLDRLG